MTFYVEAEDPQAVLDRAEELGATVVVPVTETPFVTYGRFADPDGLQVGVVKAADPVGRAAARPLGRARARRWTGSRCSGPTLRPRSGSTRSCSGGRRTRPGSRATRWCRAPARASAAGWASGEGATWATVYAKVGNVEEALARAESLGGSRVYGPNDVDDHMQTGALRDPAGNVFGVYSHPDHH